MIPPNSSLVKYDNPVLVSRNTEKKTPKVSFFATQRPARITIFPQPLELLSKHCYKKNFRLMDFKHM